MPKARLRRTWPQRLVLVFNGLLALACLTAAGLVWYGNNRLGAVQRVVITHTEIQEPDTVIGSSGAGSGGPTTTLDLSGPSRAQNFLLVGSDSRDCIDPTSPYAGAFLTGGDFGGQRSDTIMVLRADPDASQAAILSFPRDLWVKIAGSNRTDRINSSFDPQDPSRLVQTIEQNFRIPIDHYVDVDFCAFKSLVDAVGGVKVPFTYPARDRNTGLSVEQPGCVSFTGDAALAYVRSRHYQYFQDGRWKDDPSSDYGRIARQQDFIRRALQKVRDRGAWRPDIAKSLLDAGLKNVKVDQNLTINDLLKLAARLRDFDPSRVRTFRVEGTGTVIGGAAVVRPDLNSRFNQAVFKVFRGEAKLADVDNANAPTTTAAGTGGPTTTAAGGSSSAPSTSVANGTSTTGPNGPAVTVQDNQQGIYPPNDPSCR